MITNLSIAFKAFAVGLAIAGMIIRSARADAGANDAPKVEFIEVKGHECLQPVVSGAGARLADYRAAEARWLAKKYPGVPTPEAKTEILLSPDPDAGNASERTTVQRETFHLDGIAGEGAVICFEIRLVVSSGESNK